MEETKIMSALYRNAKKAEPIIKQSFRAGMGILATARAIHRHPTTLHRYCSILGIKMPTIGVIIPKRKGLVARILDALRG